jgi:hypothetical protein
MTRNFCDRGRTQSKRFERAYHRRKIKIKVLYSRLRRSINHSNMKKLLPHHVAEHIWKYGKSFEQLKKDVIN